MPYSMTACAPGYLFIGSRLGDSVFLHYIFEQSTMEESPTKKAKVEALKSQDDEDEDVELYGKILPVVSVNHLHNFL